MIRYVVAYFITLVVFLAIDFVWLTWIARPLYTENLGDLLLEKPRIGAAAAFYALYVVGIVALAISPALASGSTATALFSGALLGLLAYATYDLTNYATLRNWPLHVALLDMIWGAALTGLSAAAGYIAQRALIP